MPNGPATGRRSPSVAARQEPALPRPRPGAGPSRQGRHRRAIAPLEPARELVAQPFALAHHTRPRLATREGVVIVALEVVRGRATSRSARGDPLGRGDSSTTLSRCAVARWRCFSVLSSQPGMTVFWKCGYRTRPDWRSPCSGRVIQVQVVVGDAAVPIRARRRARNVVHGRQGRTGSSSSRAGRGASCSAVRWPHCACGSQAVAAATVRAGRKTPRVPTNRPWLCGSLCCGKSAQVAQRRAQPALAPQQMPTAAGEYMQAKARMAQHLGLVPAKALRKLLSRTALAHCCSAGGRTGQMRRNVVDVVVRHPREAGAGSPGRPWPCAKRRWTRPADESSGAAGQPVAENETVQRVQDQALGATGRSRDDAHVIRSKAMRLKRTQRARAGMDRQGFHRRVVRFSSSSTLAQQGFARLLVLSAGPAASRKPLHRRAARAAPRPAPPGARRAAAGGRIAPRHRRAGGFASSFIVSEMRLRARSTSSTLTLTMSPVFTTSRASLTNLLATGSRAPGHPGARPDRRRHRTAPRC